MKLTVFKIMKVGLALFVYMAAMTATTSLMGLITGTTISSDMMPEQSRILTGLFTAGLIQVLILSMLANRSGISGVRLGWLLSAIFFVINHGLNVIESLVFLRNIFPWQNQLSETLSGIVTSLAVGFTIARLFGNKDITKSEILEFNWSLRIIPNWILWTLLWFLIYITAGMLFPMNVQGFEEYYFGASGAMDITLVPLGYAMQIPRGAIWIIMTIYLNKSLRGSQFEKNLIIGISYGALMSSSLVIPNWIMPDLIRLAHLPEILFANLLWGFLIAKLTARHFTAKPMVIATPVHA